MIRVTILAITIGLADSLNPTTIGPALYLAAGRDAPRHVAQFTLAVFTVYLVGGLAIALGPGQLLLSLVPHPDREDRYVLETVAGAALIVGAAFLWGYRHQLMRRKVPVPKSEGKSSAILGATITAVELPTAFPYFAAIAAIVGADLDAPRDLVLLLLFNLCFVLPLLGIVAVLTFAPAQSERVVSVARDFLERHWPTVLAGVAFVAGLFVVLLGLTGFAGTHSRFFRRLHRTLRG